MTRILPLLLIPFLLSACDEEEAPDPAAVARGADLAESCRGCHQFASSANMVGPTLQGVVGRKAGAVPGYDYSPGLRGLGIDWTQENLQKFLLDPFAMVPDTKMAVGEMLPEEARDVVAYLRSLD